MRFIGPEQMPSLLPAEEAPVVSPIPTQIVSSDEYMPARQTDQQKEVETKLHQLGETVASKHGMSRRRFFQTAAGLAASYYVMNQVYGNIFEASAAEATNLDIAADRSKSLKGQMIFDAHTHFIRDDPSPLLADPNRTGGFMWQRSLAAKLGWDKGMPKRAATPEDLKFDNFFKEIYLDSDTKVALLTNAPSDAPEDWLLPQEAVFKARDRINTEAGSRRMLAHYTITPGQAGWLEGVDKAIEVHKPDGWKGYTIGDVVIAHGGHYAYKLDDEKLMYPFYERIARAGIKNVCIHKGLFPRAAEQAMPHLTAHAAVGDVGKAAKDWPQLNFVIYHSGYRHLGGDPSEGLSEWRQTGRLPWLTDLSEIPEKHGVTNVYGDLGAIFAWTVIAQPTIAAAMLGTLVRGLGADHVIWGTDSVWTGSPQWQIEAMRRLEIPEEMQKQHNFKPLGAADGPVKNGILGENGLRIFGYNKKAEYDSNDRFALMKSEYEQLGYYRSNLRYGYITKPA
ncbi:putative TIM-barrel fold metal-dependent hydrolase [Bradyrhizobium sp. USDA 4461]